MLHFLMLEFGITSWNIIQETAFLILWCRTCTFATSSISQHRLKQISYISGHENGFSPNLKGEGTLECWHIQLWSQIGGTGICHSLKFRCTGWKCTLGCGGEREQTPWCIHEIPHHSYFPCSFVFRKMWLYLQSSYWRLMFVCVRVSSSFNRRYVYICQRYSGPPIYWVAEK
jgi:hypothetical protein